MSFNTELLKEGEGFVWLLEVSNDNFATIAYRWATVACHVSGQMFDNRIAKLGKLTKGFGLDSVPQVSTVQLILDNEAFDLDWLVDVDQGPIEFTYRFRLSLGLYDKNNLDPTVDVEPTTKVMGTFGMLDSPARTDKTIELQLADDSMGRFNELASSPTINEWISDSGTTDDNCVLKDTSPTPAIDFNQPLPIVFGPRADGHMAALELGSNNNGGTLMAAGYTHAIVVCVSTDPASVTAHDVERLDATWSRQAAIGTLATLDLAGAPVPASALRKWDGAGSTMSVPQSFTVPIGDNFGWTPGSYNIWSPQKTQAISKDGRSWKILWIAVSSVGFQAWATHSFGFFDDVPVGGQANPLSSFGPVLPGYAGAQACLAAIEKFSITGYPFSARTDTLDYRPRGLTVIEDLVTSYSRDGSGSDLDLPSFATALAANPTWVAGVLQPSQPDPAKFLSPVAAAISPGLLRKAIQEIAQSLQVDLFFTWAGKLGASSGWLDFTSITTTPLAVDETRCQNVKERKPSQGERWAYYNRIYIVGPDGTARGPFDNQAAIDAVGGVKIPRTIQGKWLLDDLSGGDPSYELVLWSVLPRLQAKQRNLITFTTDREFLQADLGSLFSFTWTRGNTDAVYSGAVFRAEQISVDPGSLAVEIEGVWVNDVVTVNPYLLDDESFTGVVASGGGRTATVTDGETEVDFSSGDLNSDGVLPGDILILFDITQGDAVFSRYRALRIATVDNTGAFLNVDDPDLDFDTPGGTAVALWVIYRGKTTYPTAGSDPTHYPSGSTMYGKVTDDTGVFSDASAGNQLLDG